MIITMLEGRVAEEHIRTLVASFEASQESLPSAIVESFLVRERDSDIWRVVTVWRSREALDGYIESVDTPEGVLMFRSAGVEPALSVAPVKSRVSSE